MNVSLPPWVTGIAAALAAVAILVIVEKVGAAIHHDHKKGHR